MIKRQLKSFSVVFSAHKSVKGYTLIELLVVLSILTMLSSILVVYSRTGERQLILYKDQAKIINSIIRAKSLAVQSFSAGENVCGYGAYFDQSGKIIIFKDLSNDCLSSDSVYSGPDEDVQTDQLDGRLSFSSLDFNSVLFIPPDPIILFDGQNSPGVKNIIISGGGDSVVKVAVNSAGQITAVSGK
ncbi:MAG: hypothetical protein Athens071426_163 [Parcubacteria group bacterium Athens0714_26]|nr:MAG: hypothetical protein Athens101426_269 [Parcubacteria group bacterium Athens1014_26]TSD03619.1 MAG: hypothetical protein Athens071426_163 [Parcubacteria group bacterium Athens0714_26]